MTTQRKRATRSIGRKIDSIETKLNETSNAAVSPPENSVGESALRENSVGPSALQPDSVTSDAVGRGAVGTENLGIVNQVNSDAGLVLNTPAGVVLAGDAYVAPTAGTFSVVMDANQTLRASALTSPARTGVIENYYSSGGVMVKLNGESSYTGPYDFVSSYVPYPGDSVTLAQNPSGSYTILGKTLNDVTLPYQYTANSRGMTPYVPETYDSATWLKSSAGIVMLKGLLQTNAAVSAGAIIASVPSEVAPDFNLEFGIMMNSNVFNSVTVSSTGSITIKQAMPASTWFTLNGLRWPAKKVASWNAIGSSYDQLASVANDGTGYGMICAPGYEAYNTTPYYWVDPYKFVWFTGAIVANATAAANKTMLIADGGLRAPDQFHMPTTGGTNTASSQFTYIATSPPTSTDRGLMHGTSTPTTVGFIQQLGQIQYRCLDGDTGAYGYYTGLTTLNSWTAFSSAFPSPAYLVRGDKLVFLKGLVKNSANTPNATIATLPAGARPAKRGLRLGVSNAAYSRLDILPTGDLAPSVSSTTWFSLDGHAFSVEQ